MSSGPDSPRSFSLSSSTPSRNAFSLLAPDEFLPYVVPFTGGPGVLAGGRPERSNGWHEAVFVCLMHGCPICVDDLKGLGVD